MRDMSKTARTTHEGGRVLQTSSGTTPPALWEAVPCELYRGPQARLFAGLLALAGDSVIEEELRTMTSYPGVRWCSTRLAYGGDLSPEMVNSLAEQIPAAVPLLMPGERLNIIVYGCTSGAVALGGERLRGLIERARPGTHIIEPMTAAVRGLAALKVRRVGLLTPYSASVNASVDEYLTSQGIDVRVRRTFRAPATVRLGRTPPTRIPPEAIREAATALGRTDVDGVLILCTGLRCSGILSQVERDVGKPVVSSNQALSWYCLRHAGIVEPVGGFGQLLLS
jgi:maleate isomerase